MSAVRPAIKISFILACLAALAGSYFLNTPLPLFLTRSAEIFFTGIILWAAGGLGARLLKGLRLSAWSPLESFLYSEALGLGLLSSFMMLWGLFQGWTPLGAGLLLVGSIGLSGPFLNTLQHLLPSDNETHFIPSNFFWPGIAILVGGFLSAVLALAPITYYDSLVYHLALPAAYVHAHHWVGLPPLIYSAFPQTLEMLWTLCLLVRDDITVNLLGWSLSALLVLAVITYAKRFLDLSVGFVAAALLCLMPAFMLLSSGGYVEVGLALFSFLTFYAICEWITHPRPGLLVIAGLLAGWAMGTKYTGAISTLLAGLLILSRIPREGFNKTHRAAHIYFGCAVLMFAPWLIKNMIYVGNPVFPFFYNLGLKARNPWLSQAAAGYFAGITEYYSRPLWELPSVLWDAAVNGIHFGRGIDVLGDFGWLPLLSLLPALWLCRRLSTMTRWLLAYATAYFVIWGSMRPVLRFLFPLAPVLALLAGTAWVQGIRPQSPIVRWIARGFLGSFLLSGLFLFFYVTSMISPYAVALGLEDREHYLQRKVDYYVAAQFVNSETPPNSRVYILGDQRGYYYHRELVISPAFSPNPFVDWSNTAASPEVLRQHLQDEGITHLVVNRTEMERLSSYHYASFTEEGRRNWEQLRDHLLKPLYHDRACDVYAL